MEKHGFCHAFLFAKTLLLQKHHVRNSCCSLFAFFLLFLFFCPSVLLQIAHQTNSTALRLTSSLTVM